MVFQFLLYTHYKCVTDIVFNIYLRVKYFFVKSSHVLSNRQKPRFRVAKFSSTCQCVHIFIPVAGMCFLS